MDVNVRINRRLREARSGRRPHPACFQIAIQSRPDAVHEASRHRKVRKCLVKQLSHFLLEAIATSIVVVGRVRRHVPNVLPCRQSLPKYDRLDVV